MKTASALFSAAVAVALAAPLAPAAPATRPATQPANGAAAVNKAAVAAKAAAAARARILIPANNDFRAQNKESYKRSLEASSMVGEYRLSDLLNFSANDSQLAINWTGPEQNINGRIEVPGSNAKWVMRVSNFNRQVGAGINMANRIVRSISLIRYDFDRPDKEGPYSISLSVQPTSFSINAMYGPGSDLYSVNFYQSNGACHLSVLTMVNNGPRVAMQVAGRSIAQMQSTNPDAVRKYVRPLLKDMTGVDMLAPEAGDVYRVFAGLVPDPAVARKVEELLPGLDAIEYPDREAASAALEALGGEGVLAALRVDRSALAPEQCNRIDLFCIAHSHWAPSQLADAAKDANFLVDCMEFNDLRVRTEAKSALEDLLGHAVKLDVNASGDALAESIAALRKAVNPEPATRPAETGVAPAPAVIQIGPAILRK